MLLRKKEKESVLFAPRDPISSCRPFVRRIGTRAASRARRRAFPGSPMLSAVYNSTPAAHLWKLDFCAPGEIFFSSGRRVARRDGFRLCHRPPIQPLEMHCPYLVQTVAFPSPLTLLRRASRALGKSLFRFVIACYLLYVFCM